MEEEYLSTNQINALIQTSPPANTDDISDGYHTFGELYAHRFALFAALCHCIQDEDYQPANKRGVWKSRLHHDGTVPFGGGWFIAGIGIFVNEQISYHWPLKLWDQLHVPELEKAPLWDGHTPEDVIKRLLALG